VDSPPFDGKPVVIGSTVSGLLVSLALSRAGIEHVLLGGDKPKGEPRLGESLNETASPELWRLFQSDFKEYFYPKNHISLLNGEYASMVYLNNPNMSLDEKSAQTPPDLGFPSMFVHVDRAGLDPALYAKVREHEQCSFVQEGVREIHYENSSDAVEKLVLADGEVISRPSYVFDTTGARGLVADAADVGMTAESRAQRVVWTHGRATRDAAPEDWWRHGTNLLRLSRATDGVEGISWLIPLGDTVSIGCSFDAETYGDEGYDKQQLIESVVAGYEKRGVAIALDSSEPGASEPHAVQDMRHHYFIRDRAYGANWLLVGGTFVQIWFPSSVGLWTATSAAGIAPQLIADPQRVGAYYEKIMRRLLATHRHLEKMILNPSFASESAVYEFWSRWTAQFMRRRQDYRRILVGEVPHAARFPRAIGMFKYWLRSGVRPLRVWASRRTISCQRVPELREQGDAFPDYHRPGAFRAANRRQALRRAILPYG